MEVSSKALRKVRQSAIKAKTAISCVSCLAYGNRCSASRPCSRCIKSTKRCLPALETTNSQLEFVSPVLSHLVIEDPKASSGFIGLTYLLTRSSSTKIKAFDLGLQQLNELDYLKSSSAAAAAATVALVENNKVHKNYEIKNQNRLDWFVLSAPFAKKDSFLTVESYRIAIRKLVNDDEDHYI